MMKQFRNPNAQMNPKGEIRNGENAADSSGIASRSTLGFTDDRYRTRSCFGDFAR
jgi:hypothetical protein